MLYAILVQPEHLFRGIKKGVLPLASLLSLLSLSPRQSNAALPIVIRMIIWEEKPKSQRQILAFCSL